MATANYRQIQNLLLTRQPFKGNTMSADAGTIDGDTLSRKGRLYYHPDAATVFANLRCFTYVVYSYGTPIAGVTDTGQVVIPDVRYSPTTSRHQNLVRTYLR